MLGYVLIFSVKFVSLLTYLQLSCSNYYERFIIGYSRDAWLCSKFQLHSATKLLIYLGSRLLKNGKYTSSSVFGSSLTSGVGAAELL